MDGKAVWFDETLHSKQSFSGFLLWLSFLEGLIKLINSFTFSKFSEVQTLVSGKQCEKSEGNLIDYYCRQSKSKQILKLQNSHSHFIPTMCCFSIFPTENWWFCDSLWKHHHFENWLNIFVIVFSNTINFRLLCFAQFIFSTRNANLSTLPGRCLLSEHTRKNNPINVAVVLNSSKIQKLTKCEKCVKRWNEENSTCCMVSVWRECDVATTLHRDLNIF
jgi:hypothetical protein